MSLVFSIFCLSIFLIEISLIYNLLYLIGYKWMKLDMKIGDTALVSILLFMTLVIAILIFPSALRLVANSLY